jgi:acyclic terpene utilization AtuA family protein
MARHVRIGCYRSVRPRLDAASHSQPPTSAFWGDSASASRQLVEAEDAKLDYLVGDYLAGTCFINCLNTDTDALKEVTMGLLARASRSGKTKGPRPPGYIKEFLTLVLKPLLQTLLDKNIKVITNAGGLDPVGLKELIEAFAAEAGESSRVKVAAVYGDDVLLQKDKLHQAGAITSFDPLNGAGPGEDLVSQRDELLSLNAYLGAEPIAKALAEGANIIVTGRCVDSASIVGPLAFEYGWDFSRLDDTATLDHFAAASLAGHILECGAQATGGNFTDWELSAGSGHGGWANMGYPIATFDGTGAFTVSKPKNTGGLVTRHTVAEQMLYEVLDPENYILPDVVLDLSRVILKQAATDVVRVSGARGKPPTEHLKCTAVRQNGYRVSADMLVFGADAGRKGTVLGEAIVRRCRDVAEGELSRASKPADLSLLESDIIIVGAEHSVPAAVANRTSREVVLRVTAKHTRPDVLAILAREVASFATSSAPGLAMFSAGRPKVSPNFSASSLLLRREGVTPIVQVGTGKPRSIPLATRGCGKIASSPSALTVRCSESKPPLAQLGSRGSVRLLDIAVGRSGDKGDSSNIAIIARDPAYYPYIRSQVTPDVMRATMQHVLKPDSIITRYDVPGISAVNFVLTKSLGGGGLDSLTLDR